MKTRLSLLMIVLIAALAIFSIATHAPPEMAMNEITFESLSQAIGGTGGGIQPCLVSISTENPVSMIEDGGFFNSYSQNACGLNRLLTVAVSDDLARCNGWFANIGYNSGRRKQIIS